MSMLPPAIPALALALTAAACAQQQQVVFEPSRKSAAELRAMQVRVVDGEPEAVMRGVVATLHDLGYRITRIEADSGTVSATRKAALRMAVVVQAKPPDRSVVRANATLLGVGREGQVDSPEFYAANFFRPLGAALHRDLALLSAHDDAPEAVRPVAERTSSRLSPGTEGPPPSSPPAQELPR